MGRMIEFILFWVACGVLSHGMMLAYFQREWSMLAEESYKGDFISSLIPALFGPGGLAASVVFLITMGCNFKHGFKLY